MTRVLLVDDHRGFTKLLAAGLRAQGYEVLSINDSAMALKVARVFAPDVIVSDLSMPGIDGYELARQVRADEALKDVRLIAGTGQINPDNVTQCFEAGFSVYLEKPFTHSEVSDIIEAQSRARTLR